MVNDSRADLQTLLAAFERHYEVAVSLKAEGLDLGDTDSPIMADAEENLRNAFFTYDDSLFTSTGAELPFDLLDDYDENLLDDNAESADDFYDEDDLEDFDLDSED